MRPLCLGIAPMKAYMLITGSGPIVILTSHDSVVDAALIKKLASKGIEKFIATRFRSVLLKNAMVRISRLCRAMSGKPTISVCSTMTEAARSSCSGSMNSVRRCSTSRRHKQCKARGELAEWNSAKRSSDRVRSRCSHLTRLVSRACTIRRAARPAEALGPAHVAGVEAAIWAETISDFDDLCFLLLPRLAGVAHKGWSDPQVATWTDHRDRIAKADCGPNRKKG